MQDRSAKLTLVLIFCAAALLLVAACYAQQGWPPQGPPSPAQELARMTRELALSEAQSVAILPILEDRHEAIAALIQNGAGRRVNEPKIHALFDSTNQEIKVVLTEAQQQLFDAMRPPKPPAKRAGPGSSGLPTEENARSAASPS